MARSNPLSFSPAYVATLDSRLGNTIEVALLREDYTGSTESMRLSGPGVTRQAARSESHEFTPLKAQVVELHLHPTDYGVVDDVYATDDAWRVRIRKNGSLDFLGPVRKKLRTTSDDKFPTRDGLIYANCGLGQLKEKSYESLRREVRIQHILELLWRTRIRLQVAVASDFWAPNMVADDDPFRQEELSAEVYSQGEEPMSCYDALEDILREKEAFVTQERGMWHVHQRHLHSEDSFSRFVYDPGGLGFQTSPVENTYTARRDASAPGYTGREKGGETSGREYHTSVEVTYDHGTIDNILVEDQDEWTLDAGVSTALYLKEEARPGYAWVQPYDFGDDGSTVEQQLTDRARLQSGRYLSSSWSLGLTVYTYLEISDGATGNTPYDLVSYVKIIFEGESGTTYYLKRDVSPDPNDPSRYVYQDASWTQDSSDWVAFIQPWDGSSTIEQDLSTSVPPPPEDGLLRAHVGRVIDPRPGEFSSDTVARFEASVPVVIPTNLENKEIDETTYRAEVSGREETEPYEVTVLHGSGPTAAHEATVSEPFASKVVPIDAWADEFILAESDGEKAELLLAKTILYQLAQSDREALQRTYLDENVEASLTKTIVRGGDRYLPTSIEWDYLEDKRRVTAVQVAYDTGLTVSTEVVRSTGGGGSDGGSAGGGGGGGTASWDNLLGKPDDIFSRSGTRDTVPLADSDITGALGFDPLDPAGDVMDGDLALDDGSDAGGVLRGAPRAVEVREQADPSSYGTLVAGAVEIVDGATASSIESQTVELTDSLLELNKDAAGDAWGGQYIYRGKRADGSGSGLVSKAVVWNPAADQWGVADVDAEKDANNDNVGTGVLTATFEQLWHDGNDGPGSGLEADLLDGYQGADLAARAEDETIPGAWTFEPTQVFEQGLEDDTFSKGLLAGDGFAAYEDSDGRSVMEADVLRARDYIEALEFIVEKVRATGGSIVVSAGTMMVSGVSGSGPYTLTSEDDHSLAVGDAIEARRQGTNAHFSQLRVTSVPDPKTVEVSLHSGDAPAAGMEYVVKGNDQTADRQNVIYITATDSPAPRIDQYEDSTGWDLAQATRTGRFGVDPTGDMVIEAGRGLLGSLDKSGQYLEYGDGKATLAGALHQVGGNAPTEAGLWATDGSLGFHDGAAWTSEIRDDGSGQLAGGAIRWTSGGQTFLEQSVSIGGRGLSTTAFQATPAALFHYDKSARDVITGKRPVAATGQTEYGLLQGATATLRDDGLYGGAIAVEHEVANELADDGDLEDPTTLVEDPLNQMSSPEKWTLRWNQNANQSRRIVPTQPASAGQKWHFSVWHRGRDARLELGFLDSDGNLIQNDATAYESSATWARKAITANAPSGTAEVQAGIRDFNTGVSRWRYFQLEQHGDEGPTSFVDGSRGTPSLEYSIDPAAHAKMTFSMWVKCNPTQFWHILWKNGDGNLGNGEGLVLAWHKDDMDLLLRQTGSGGPEWELFTPQNTADLRTWTHVVVTRDVDKWTIYVDGQEVASRTEQVATTSYDTTHLGYVPGGNRKGNLLYDDVSLWGYAMSAEDVRRVHESSAPLQESPQTAASVARDEIDAAFEGAITRGETIIQGGYLRNAIVDTQVLEAGAVTADKITVDDKITLQQGGILEAGDADFRYDKGFVGDSDASGAGSAGLRGYPGGDPSNALDWAITPRTSGGTFDGLTIFSKDKLTLDADTLGLVDVDSGPFHVNADWEVMPHFTDYTGTVAPSPSASEVPERRPIWYSVVESNSYTLDGSTFYDWYVKVFVAARDEINGGMVRKKIWEQRVAEDESSPAAPGGQSPEGSRDSSID
jgi:hypothetical protein